MRGSKYITILISLLITVGLSAQGLREEIICTDSPDGNILEVPYDTSAYTSEWFLLGESTSFSTADSISVMDRDMVVLRGTPVDTSLAIINDTISVALRISPIIDISIPAIECFTGDSILIMDNSIIYGPYTTVSYSNASGQTVDTFNPNTNWFVDNGDSTSVRFQYSITECSLTIDTSFTIATIFTPVSNFDKEEFCFGENTIITNNSQFDRNIASFSLVVEDVQSFNNAMDMYQFSIPENGSTRDVFVEINQEGCITLDTFQVTALLSPTAGFTPEKTCENELLQINNNSSNTTLSTSYTLNIDGDNFPFNSIPNFNFQDTFPDGIYNVTGIVDNWNGCIDTLEFDIEIDSVTYVNFQNLESAYCQFEESEIIVGSENGGEFTGQFITDFNNGSAIFNPTEVGSNIGITYTFTNPLSCTDKYTESVDTVYEKPEIILTGLEPAYCELGIASLLSINQTINNNSEYEIRKNGIFFDSENSLNYEFDPVEPGLYEIINFYEDNNGCLDTLISNTVVNPNPNVEVDSLIILTPGEFMIIGNNSAPEPDVDYRWSNSSNSSSIEISQPGIYIISAENLITGCMKSDTATVQYDATIETELVNVQISPNPTQGPITLTLDQQKQGIRIIDVFGLPVTINGQSEFNTDTNGVLNIDLSNQVSGYYYLLIQEIGNFLLLKI